MNIYIISDLNSLTKFTCIKRSSQLKDIFPWSITQMITKISLKISSHGTSLKWSQRPCTQHENSHKLYDKTGHPVRASCFEFDENQWKLRQHDQGFPMEGNDCRTNTNVRRIKKSKRTGLWEPQSGIRWGKLTT